MSQRVMTDVVIVSSELKLFVLDTQMKRGAEQLIDHHLVVIWAPVVRKAPGKTQQTQMCSVGEYVNV